MSLNKTSIGIDIGGTEIKGAVVSEKGEILHRFSKPTCAENGLNGIKNSLTLVLENTLAAGGESAVKIGIASAGNIDCEKGKVVYATDNLPNYTGFDIFGFVKKFSKLPVLCDNDAYCALKGEMAHGSARGMKDVLMLTLGTGVGGAAAINGEILRGKNFAAARFGHTMLIADGRQCNCGKKGCAEQYLSGTAFTQGAKKLGLNISHGSEVFGLAEKDEKVQKYVRGFFTLLGEFTVSLCSGFDPEAVVIGGGLINSSNHWWSIFENSVNLKEVKLLRASLGNNAGIIGAVS